VPGRCSIVGRLVAALSLLGVACGGSGPAEMCQHPCDLNQTVRVEITDSESAASLTASGACEAQLTCRTKDDCARVDLYLKNGGPVWSDPDAGDMICHIVAVSRLGVTVERDVSAHYTAAACCSGWEFSYGGSVMIAFAPRDAAAVD
jgi:hypothetical protein